MPGIFGAVAKAPQHTPLAVAEIMRQSLTHEPWYGGVMESFGQRVVGALSTNPFFNQANHLAQRPEALLLVEGGGMGPQHRLFLKGT